MSLRTKLATFGKLTRQVKNWPGTVAVQFFSLPARENHTLCLRNGLRIEYRVQAQDWEIVKELLLDSTYGRTFDWLRQQARPVTLLDLGANIGLFSLVAAGINPRVEVHCYEPAAGNVALLEKNRLANPDLAGRIHAHPEAVGGTERTATFYFNEKVPQASGFYSEEGRPVTVQVRSLAGLLENPPVTPLLIKMDIEGAEYEVFRDTPAAVWKNVAALAVEIHADPLSQQKREDLVRTITALGFTGEKEPGSKANYFFRREG